MASDAETHVEVKGHEGGDVKGPFFKINSPRMQKGSPGRGLQLLHKDKIGKPETPDKASPVKKIGIPKKPMTMNQRKGPTMASAAPTSIKPVSTAKPLTTMQQTPPQNTNINKYKYQVRRLLQSVDEYRKLETNIKLMQDNLNALRSDIIAEGDTGELQPIPDVQSTIQEILNETCPGNIANEDDKKRLAELETEVATIKECLNAAQEEKRKVEENLKMLSQILREKEDELMRRELIEEEQKKISLQLQLGDEGSEVDNLKKIISQLHDEKLKLLDELQSMGQKMEAGDARGENENKVRSLESLIENLHVCVKNLKDQLKGEKEAKARLEAEYERMMAEVEDLKKLNTSMDHSEIVSEKESKIKDLQSRLDEISKVRQYQPSSEEEEKVFRVDYSGDTLSLVTQLAKFVQLYEEVTRESFDMETRLKDAHMEIYRLEQILQKQLAKIKEQDACLKNMEGQMANFVAEIKKSKANIDQCKCSELQIQMKEKDEVSDKMKEKISALYQKYKQYKSECNLMKKRLDSFEKRSWLKKLINI